MLIRLFAVVFLCGFVPAVFVTTSLAGTAPDESDRKKLDAALSEYEGWWLGRSATISGDLQHEVNLDGTVIRTTWAPVDLESKGGFGRYGLVECEQIFTMPAWMPSSPDVLPPSASVEFLANASKESLLEQMIGFPLAPVINGQLISKWIQGCSVKQVKNPRGDGSRVLGFECVRNDAVDLAIWIDGQGRLAGIDEAYVPGDRLKDGSVLPVGKSSRTFIEIYYTSTEIRLPSKISTKARDSDFSGESTIIVQWNEQKSELPNRITLPSFPRVVDGLGVVCSAQPNNKFVLKDGRVVALIDGMTLREIESLRYRSAGGWHMGYYLCCLVFLALLIVFLGRRYL